MNRKCSFSLAGLLLVTFFSTAALAQKPAEQPIAQPDYKLLTTISLCRDVPCLNAYREQVGVSKLARIVFYEKWILLEPSRTAAEGLLRNLPESESEQSLMMALREWHDNPANSKEDLSGLAEIYESWPRSIADAVIVFPQYLPAYIRFGTLAPNDVHSDYTGNEERVCRKDPARFRAAFEMLNGKTQAHLRKHVFDPEKCRAIFVSDSE